VTPRRGLYETAILNFVARRRDGDRIGGSSLNVRLALYPRHTSYGCKCSRRHCGSVGRLLLGEGVLFYIICGLANWAFYYYVAKGAIALRKRLKSN
jgi:hypothetical protein